MSWRAGDRLAPKIGSELMPKPKATLGIGESGTYLLRVIDTFAQADKDSTMVEVVDTTPPAIFCNASTTINPTESADEKPHPKETPKESIAFTATATDICDAEVMSEITGFDCYAFTKKGKRIDKTESCVVEFDGDTITILDSGSVGDHITWTVSATDDTGGNAAEITCEVEVIQLK